MTIDEVFDDLITQADVAAELADVEHVIGGHCGGHTALDERRGEPVDRDIVRQQADGRVGRSLSDRAMKFGR